MYPQLSCVRCSTFGSEIDLLYLHGLCLDDCPEIPRFPIQPPTSPMNLSLFFQAIAIGLAIAAPVGPIGLLCIQRTLARGYAIGLLSGLGAASADAVYGTIGGLGLVAIAQRLASAQVGLQLGGGLFLCYLGFKSCWPSLKARFSRQPNSSKPDGGSSISTASSKDLANAKGWRVALGAYFSTFLLTLSNPITILAFVALFASVGLGGDVVGSGSALVFVAGVFAGSALWWWFLCGGVSLLRRRLRPRHLRGLDVLSGLAIAGFGLVAIGQGVGKLFVGNV